MLSKWKGEWKNMTWQQMLMNVACLCIALAGIVVSIRMNLVGRALWYDESALAYSLCQRGLLDLTATELDYVQSAPVGWLYVLKIFTLIFGNSTYALRTPSILAYVGIMFLMYYILKHVFHTYYPMAGVAFGASLPIILQYSNVFKPYITDCVFVLLAIVIFYQYNEKKINSLTMGILWAVLLWFSNPVIFVMAGLMMSKGLLALMKKDMKAIKGLFGAGIIILVSFAVYYFYWLRQTAVENTSMLNYWAEYNFPLLPRSLEDIKRAVRLIGLLFQPFYRLEYVVMILLAAFAFYTLKKKDVYLMGIYLSFFVALVASYLDKYPINKRLWLFIYPLITIIIFVGLDDFINREEKNHRSVYTVGVIMLGIAVLNSGIRYYVHEEKVYWPGYEVGLEYDYMKEHIQDEWVYIFWPIIPEFAHVNQYNTEYLEGTDTKVVYGTEMFSSQDESTKDIDMILDSSNCYLFFSDSWDNESYTDELFITTRGTGYLEMVYNDYATPLWRYCKDIEDVKSGVSYEILDQRKEDQSITYTLRVTNTGESYLNPKFETAGLKCSELGSFYELPEDMAPGQAVDLTISLPAGTVAEFTLENEYGLICPDAELILGEE